LKAAPAAQTARFLRGPEGVSNLRPRKLRINLFGRAKKLKREPAVPFLIFQIPKKFDQTPQFERSKAPQTLREAQRPKNPEMLSSCEAAHAPETVAIMQWVMGGKFSSAEFRINLSGAAN